MDIESIRKRAECFDKAGMEGYENREPDMTWDWDAILDRRELLSEVDRLSVESALRQRDADTARAEVEKLRERAAADVAKLYAERDESDRVGYARLQEIERLRAEVKSLREPLGDAEASDVAMLRSLVAECRPVVELVRTWQADDNDIASPYIRELAKMKLPAMEGGESMTRMIKLSIAPATETHCGDGDRRCPQWDPGYVTCGAFWKDPADTEYDHRKMEYKRLPACIAAEVGAEGKGT